MKKYFVKLSSQLSHSTIHQVMRYFWVFTVNPFSLFFFFFFSRKLCFFCSPCLLLIAKLISLETSGKPAVGFFLKITSPTWRIFPISPDELNSIDWLLKSWRWIFLKLFLFYYCERILIWQKVLEIFWRIYLNIIFWILLWMLTSLVIWNLNMFVNTATSKP